MYILYGEPCQLRYHNRFSGYIYTYIFSSYIWVLRDNAASDCQRWHPLLLRLVGQWQLSSLGLGRGNVIRAIFPAVAFSFYLFRFIEYLKRGMVDVGAMFLPKWDAASGCGKENLMGTVGRNPGLRSRGDNTGRIRFVGILICSYSSGGTSQSRGRGEFYPAGSPG